MGEHVSRRKIVDLESKIVQSNADRQSVTKRKVVIHQAVSVLREVSDVKTTAEIWEASVIFANSRK